MDLKELGRTVDLHIRRLLGYTTQQTAAQQTQRDAATSETPSTGRASSGETQSANTRTDKAPGPTTTYEFVPRLLARAWSGFSNFQHSFGRAITFLTSGTDGDVNPSQNSFARASIPHSSDLEAGYDFLANERHMISDMDDVDSAGAARSQSTSPFVDVSQTDDRVTTPGLYLTSLRVDTPDSVSTASAYNDESSNDGGLEAGEQETVPLGDPQNRGRHLLARYYDRSARLENVGLRLRNMEVDYLQEITWRQELHDLGRDSELEISDEAFRQRFERRYERMLSRHTRIESEVTELVVQNAIQGNVIQTHLTASEAQKSSISQENVVEAILEDLLPSQVILDSLPAGELMIPSDLQVEHITYNAWATESPEPDIGYGEDLLHEWLTQTEMTGRSTGGFVPTEGIEFVDLGSDFDDVASIHSSGSEQWSNSAVPRDAVP